jgi:hypothetical protein
MQSPSCTCGANGAQNSVIFQDLPADYDEAMVVMKAATQTAIADGGMLLEIEFPTAGLFSVAGDAEGQNEMTYSLEFLRQYLSMFQSGAGAQATRIFFPDKNVLPPPPRNLPQLQK